MNIRKSLVTKYLFLILVAILMWPVLPTLYYLPGILVNQHPLYQSEDLLEMWGDAADQLDEADEDAINEKLTTIQETFPDADLFWVDETGKTHFVNERRKDVPDRWTSFKLVNYLDQEKQHGMYTMTATIGKDARQGFMVFLIPKSQTSLAVKPLFGDSTLVLLMFFVGVSLVIISLLFFLNIRKRIVRLRNSMTKTGESGIPDTVTISKTDEIGQLENAFNRMVHQLKESREREKEEEHLRKQVIANISHDVRTPLTVIQQHAYTVQKEPLTSKAAASMQIIINKLKGVGTLLENLLTYTLLSAGKYPMERTKIDVIEEMRNALAEWYPIFEKEGFEVEVDLPDQTLEWEVDPLWMRSIIENLFQNVIRHARFGKYIGVETIEREGVVFLALEDKGPGIEHHSNEKGAGIGLSIITLMTKEMDIEWEVSSSPNGTCHYLAQKLN